MGLSIAIVGLPNVGKSTLFNALLQKQQALAANYPFATIDPNVGIVEIPDERLERLAEVISNQGTPTLPPRLERGGEGKKPPLVRATVSFVDIAGLVKGASQGEGLGNKFLANIRETDAICHVLRAFHDENVIRAGAVDPVDDLEVIRTELILADLETIQKAKGKIKNNSEKLKIYEKLENGLGQGKMVREILEGEELKEVRDLFLLSSKPELFALNVDEDELAKAEEIKRKFVERANGVIGTPHPGPLLKGEGITSVEGIKEEQVIVVCAKIEAELADLSGEEKQEFMKELGIVESGLDKLASAGYKTLGLMSFLTAGEIECRAWTIKKGSLAPQAAGVIHTDFELKFIKAKVCGFEDFVKFGGWKGAAENGKVRMEGREYVMKEGDVVEFMIGA